MSFFKRKLSKKTPPSPKPGASPKPGGSPFSPQPGRVRDHVYNGDTDLDDSRHAIEGFGARPKVLLLNTDDMSPGHSPHPPAPLPTTSRLSKTFSEVMADAGATQCLLGYLRSQRAGHLLQFWLDSQSFQAATWSRLQAQSSVGTERGHQRSQSNVSVDRPPGHQRSQSSVSVDMAHQRSHNIGKSATHCLERSVQNKLVLKRTESCPSQGSENVQRTDRGHASRSEDITLPNRSPAQSSHTKAQPCDNGQCDAATPSSQSASERTSRTTGSAETLGVSQSTDSPESSPSSTLSGTQPSANSSHTDAHTTLTTSTPGDTDDTVSTTTPGTHTTPSVSIDTTHILPEEAAMASPSSPGASSLPEAKNETLLDKLKKSIEKDAVKIYAQYISKDAIHDIGISDELRNATISKICREDGQVDPQCFVPCQEFVLEAIKQQYHTDFLQSVFYCKHQVDVLTNTHICLADILYNESAIIYFMEYLEQEHAMLLLQCWLELDSFQKHLASQGGQYDAQQAQSDAMVIYDKYFSLQATQPLGFDDSVRFSVEGNICREEGPLPDCFCQPKEIILRTIDKKYFRGYQQSDLYMKYLSDLVTTVQMAQDLPPVRRKRTGSDASSELSLGSHSTGSETVGTRNTLLATDTSGFHIKKALTKINDDMRIDGELLNPDALWKRNLPGSLSLGKMDRMGQFISEFDPEPDRDRKKKGGFFKKNKEKEKAQEEMAMQVAQMIISDIAGTTGSPLVTVPGVTGGLLGSVPGVTGGAGSLLGSMPANDHFS